MVCVHIHIHTHVHRYIWDKKISILISLRWNGNQQPTSFISFQCFICLKHVKNPILINADSLFLQPADSWLQASDWNIFSPNGRQKTSLGMQESVSTLRTSWQRFTEQSLVKVTLKNLEQIKGSHKKVRIVNILHVTQVLQPVLKLGLLGIFQLQSDVFQSELFR